MGITGLLLCGFLVAHLGGNFMIFLGPEMIDKYATNLHALGPILILLELGLAAIFVIHIWMAISLSRENTAARAHSYSQKESKQEKSIWIASPSTWMLISGITIFAFLVLHMIDIRFGLRDNLTGFVYPHGFHNEPTPEQPVVHMYDRVIAILRTPLSAGLYIVAMIFIAFHLSHGFQSAFRSLGIAHPFWSKFLEKVGLVFAWAMMLGFASIPVWVWAFNIQVQDSHEVAVEQPAEGTSAAIIETSHQPD
ncbi:hypothetical protein V22_38450 [Calycomorphotria hydatis]|uniref:Succinate dehydrogenase/Fumarate reductase transmembrane subunit n=2 Tax=Calycomorphotria hydatis TaxID=2528027 RepID=A0A517TDX9_9PLAN|nr:hypothetical protein V22_38450 [Calycomorphotria hydatis]